VSLIVGAIGAGGALFAAYQGGLFNFAVAHVPSLNLVREASREVGADVRAQALALAARERLKVSDDLAEDDFDSFQVADCRDPKEPPSSSCRVPELTADLQAVRLAPIRVAAKHARALATLLPSDDWSTWRDNRRWFNYMVSDRKRRRSVEPAALLTALEEMTASLTESAYRSDPE